ncbi:MAG: 3-hydroxyacyl-CoA dehydrogenase NAD-binding domain-containing protein [Alphaproteobacteria bacterium]
MITTEIDADGIATLTLDMPGRSMNVLSEASIAALASATRAAIADDKVKGVILASGKRDFIAGADLDMLLGLDGAEEVFEKMSEIQALFREIETGGKPFVAAINGMALGGGYEIAMACHHRIAGDDARARIGLPEALIGLMPGGGGTQRLPRMIGIRAALPLLLEGRKLGVGDARATGLIDAIAPADELLEQAKRWLMEAGDPVQPWDKKGYQIPGGGVQAKSGYETFVPGNAMLRQRTLGNYPNALAILSSVYEGLQTSIDVGLRVETRYFTQVVRSPEAKAMIRTLFFSMQEANKLARRPADVPRAEFKKIGVLGAGLMGAGIAHVSALAGIEVVLIDIDKKAAEAGRAVSATILERQVKRGRMDAGSRDAILERITPSIDYDDLKGADLVIEAVFEDRAIKAEVTKKAEAAIPKDAIFATNTSTLPIAGLAQASARPANFIGLHFFSPVPRMPLVEIIPGAGTADATLARVMDFVKTIGKTPIAVGDARGFFASRVFATYTHEGLAMLAEGINPALIENAGRIAGMPMGPLELCDVVSIGLMDHIARQTAADLGKEYRARPGGEVVELFAGTLGRTGKAAGKGFYDYPAEGPKRLWPDLGRHFARADKQPDVGQVKRRLMHIQGIETARCVEENIVTDPRDADVGSILGWGFAPFTGGVLSYIDMVGSKEFVAECDVLAQEFGPRFTPPALLREMAAKGKGFYQ